jgi:molybdopterin-containing oxidoreductase family membrane subunit
MQSVNYKTVDTLVLNTLRPPTLSWYILFGIILLCLAVGVSCWTYQILNGIGSSAKSNPVNWGVYITTFVFWVGIAHSGTLISAVLYLFRAKFRMPIYRIAEAMTVFAVITAGLFPIIHLGRPWTFYWLLPYPNQMALWPNFRSPLLWDVFAVTTYLTISSVFFYVGLLPDIATARDQAQSKFRKLLYSIASLGWRGDAEKWKHYASAYLLFAAFATPLVVSVHSVVSWDFAVSVIPGWHATIFPPYFVAGAIFSGVAMVLTLIIPLRAVYKLHPLIRAEHFDAMSKLTLVTSCIVGFAYITEFYTAWWSKNPFERFQFWFRPTGDLALGFWIMFVCNVVLPQLLWIKKLRTHIGFLFVLSIFINIGMWFERYNIILQSLYRDYLPSAWGHYNFSWVELGILLGSFGWFGMWMMLFIKFFPSVAITEIKEILPVPKRHEDDSH